MGYTVRVVGNPVKMSSFYLVFESFVRRRCFKMHQGNSAYIAILYNSRSRKAGNYEKQDELYC